MQENLCRVCWEWVVGPGRSAELVVLLDACCWSCGAYVGLEKSDAWFAVGVDLSVLDGNTQLDKRKEKLCMKGIYET